MPQEKMGRTPHDGCLDRLRESGALNPSGMNAASRDEYPSTPERAPPPNPSGGRAPALERSE